MVASSAFPLRTIELVAELAEQFTLRPCQALVVEGDGQDALLAPAVALDLFRIAALAAVAFGVPPHCTPPSVSIAQSRIAMASASLSSAGENPRACAAAIIAALLAFPLPVAWRLIVPTGTP